MGVGFVMRDERFVDGFSHVWILLDCGVGLRALCMTLRAFHDAKGE